MIRNQRTGDIPSLPRKLVALVLELMFILNDPIGGIVHGLPFSMTCAYTYFFNETKNRVSEPSLMQGPDLEIILSLVGQAGHSFPSHAAL